MFASVLTEILACFASFVSMLFSLEIVAGVSIGNLIVASTLLNLTMNLLQPALSGASSRVGKLDYSHGVSDEEQYKEDVRKSVYRKKVNEHADKVFKHKATL